MRVAGERLRRRKRKKKTGRREVCGYEKEKENENERIIA